MVFERSTITYSRKDEDHNKEYYHNQGENYNRNGNSNENRYEQGFFGGKVANITLTGKNVSLLKTVDLNISEYAIKWQPEMSVHMEQDANSAMI